MNFPPPIVPLFSPSQARYVSWQCVLTLFCWLICPSPPYCIWCYQDFSFAIKLVHDHVLAGLVAPTPDADAKRPRPDQQKQSSSSATSLSGTHSSSQGSAASSDGRPAKMPRTDSSSSSSSSLTAATRPSSRSQPPPPASTMGGAIIIVPNSLSSVICSLNAVDFLRDGKYISVEEKRSQHVKREPEQRFQYTLKSGKTVRFVIVDSPAKLRDSDWQRVAAVFAQGQAWQFKGWKWSNPVELFNNVFGAHITMDDRELDATIVSWSCKVFKVRSTPLSCLICK
jgi:hypothetical protein